MAPTDAELRAAIKAHLGRYLGPPGETFTVSGNPKKGARVQRVEIPFFLPEQHVKHAVFATIGGSAYEMADGGRMEAMVVLAKTPQTSFDPIHALLASFATYAETHQKVLDMGDVLPAKEMLAAIAPRFEAVMLVPPVPVGPELAHLAVPKSDVVVDFMWLLPLVQKEADYALAHGAENLMALFALERVDPTDLERKVLDTSRKIPDLETINALLEAPPKQASYRSEERGNVIAITRRGARKPKS